MSGNNNRCGMSSSREDSPDWLRSFQAPTSVLTLSSDSSSSPKCSPFREDKTDGNEDDGKVAMEEISEKYLGRHAANHSIWTLSSDSESSPDHSPKKKEKISLSQESGEANDPVLTGRGEKSPRKKTSKGKSPKKGLTAEVQTPEKEKNVNDDVKITENDGDIGTAEDASGKHIEPHVFTSRLPLVLSEKVHHSKVGNRFSLASLNLPSLENWLKSIKGDLFASRSIIRRTIYKTTIVPSRTFCIVSFGQSEAKIEAIMDDFIQLKPQSSVYEAETMVEGTLDGFSFDSEDEFDKMPKAIPHQTDQNEGIDRQINGKAKGKAEKTSMASRKRGKTAGGKPQPLKKVGKKTVVSKKPKAKK
ncbi:hypothetical protein CRYUN_Cryun19dG0100400 [Craigia yunnanensis]